MHGAMIITRTEDGEFEVSYRMHMSDDIEQNWWDIASSKLLVYRELAEHGITEVLFRSDGAGAYRNAKLRALQGRWKEWAGVDEVSLRTSQPGVERTGGLVGGSGGLGEGASREFW